MDYIVIFAVFFLKFVLDADGDPQWWEDIRTAISEESARNLLETIMENDEAPSPNDIAIRAAANDRPGARRRIGKCSE